MTAKRSDLAIGVFVTIGILSLVSIIIWLGASQYLKKGNTYVTFFDESVQGLVEDSAVKYRGVDVGRVKSILVAPDNRHIEVIIKISLDDSMVRNTVALLKTAGLTGIVYVELELKGPEDRVPQLSFAVSYPVIPSRLSQIQQILTKVEQIIDEMRHIDFQGISAQTQQTLRAAEGLISGPQIEQIMTTVQSAAVRLDRIMVSLERTVSGGKVDGVLDETVQAVTEARKLISQLRAEVNALKLGEIAGKTDQAIQGLTGKSYQIAEEVRKTSEILRRASESLDMLIQRLNTNPSLLIRSSAPAERGE
jgi:phospholipid/cholesterol/gamma-HCH transport system substrate-binding protein